jgi:hypothetical protein
MKALLIIVLLGSGRATSVTPMPTMEGCQAAAQQVNAVIRGWAGAAICVEKK